MDFDLIAKVLAIGSGFGLGSYNAVFSQNVMPHLHGLPPSVTTPIFAKIYYMGATTILPIAATAISAYGYLAYSSSPDKRKYYGASAALMLGTLPLTQLVMGPTINRLIEISKSVEAQNLAGAPQEVAKLLNTWTRLNYFRASMHMTAGLIGIITALR